MGEADAVGTQAIALEVIATGGGGETQPDAEPDVESMREENERLLKDRDYWRNENARLRREKAEARKDYFLERNRPPEFAGGASAQGDSPEVGPKPKKENFDDYDKYLDAVLEHERKVVRAELKRDQGAENQQRELRTRLDATREKILSEGYQKYEDFEQVALNDSVPITPMVMDILSQTDRPTDIAYALGKDRSLAIQLSRSNPMQAQRLIARIEASLPPDGAPSQPRKVTNAPPPIKPLGSGGSSGVEKDPNKMSQAEYEEYRRKQGARRF